MGYQAMQEALKRLSENPAILKQFVDKFPYPVELYTPEGILMLSNKAFLKEFNIPFSAFTVGRIDIFDMPLLDRFKGRDLVKALFDGTAESNSMCDIPVPTHFIKRHNGIFVDRKETCFMDISGFSIKDETGKIMCVAFVIMPKNRTTERSEITAAKKYIEEHWLDEFNADATANAVSLSKSHFTRLFKGYTGLTPHEYYIKIKTERLKEALLDGNLLIEEAFARCGIAYHGYYAKLFKKETGLTPSQYRNKYIKENDSAE